MQVLQLLRLPVIYFLNHCKYIQQKSFEIKLAQGKTCNFPSRAVAAWQALGPHPASWSNWNSGPKLVNGNGLVRTEIFCPDCRRRRGRLCVQNMCFAAHTWRLSTVPLSTSVGQGSTQDCSFLFLFSRANFWANAQANQSRVQEQWPIKVPLCHRKAEISSRSPAEESSQSFERFILGTKIDLVNREITNVNTEPDGGEQLYTDSCTWSEHPKYFQILTDSKIIYFTYQDR